MSDLSSEIILHNYPQSPVAEKIRVVLGIKNAPWHNVEIPRIPPKPMLIPLTGGYRRTPVMQIGADIYCDSLCILNELDQRFSASALYSEENAGLAWCLGRWADGEFFKRSIEIVLGAAGDALPPEFAQDRGRLYFGQDWAKELKQAGDTLPHLAAQMRSNLEWLDEHFRDKRAFMMGDTPSAIDAQIYHVIWFLRGRWKQGPKFLSEFDQLIGWEKRMMDLGHGTQSEMSAEKALEIATQSKPISVSGVANGEPQNISMGGAVKIRPAVDGAEQPVEGKVVFADAQKIVIAREEPTIGTLHVHFPRAGYEVVC